MKLLVMRHGRAEEARAGKADRDRALTTIGVDMLHHQAFAMLYAGLMPDRLFCSPYLRARQTAEVIGDVFRLVPETAGELAPGAGIESYETLLDRVEEAPPAVMCIHHQPDVSAVVHGLTGTLIPIEEGNLVVIELQQLAKGRGVLKGIYEAERMARIGRYLTTTG